MKPIDNFRGYEKQLGNEGVKLSKRYISIPQGCWMCGKQGVKMSKEHVIPDWLQRYFKIQNEKMRQAHVSSTGSILATREVQFASLRQGRICKTACNGGWMSELEAEFQNLFINNWQNGIRSEPLVFARWIAKTLTIINISQPRKVMIDELGRYGIANKNGLPEGWRVYIYETNSEMPETITWEQGGPIMAYTKSEQKDSKYEIIERVFAGCIKVGNMVGVAYYTPNKVKDLRPLLPLTEIYPEQENSLAIFPYGGIWFNQCMVNIDLDPEEWQSELASKADTVTRIFEEHYPQHH